MAYEGFLNKCKICVHRDNPVMCNGMYDPYDLEDGGCVDYEYFQADKLRVIELAREMEMSISDLLALINL